MYLLQVVAFSPTWLLVTGYWLLVIVIVIGVVLVVILLLVISLILWICPLLLVGTILLLLLCLAIGIAILVVFVIVILLVGLLLPLLLLLLLRCNRLLLFFDCGLLLSTCSDYLEPFKSRHICKIFQSKSRFLWSTCYLPFLTNQSRRLTVSLL